MRCDSVLFCVVRVVGWCGGVVWWGVVCLVWCGVPRIVWCGVVRRDVMRCGVESCDHVALCGAVWCGEVW